MNSLLSHRGPDDDGFYEDDLASLGHRRLSIIDLSENARQPMHNEDSTVWMAVNGEIYNFKELRTELEASGHIFHSHGDSEVIIHAYEQFGDNFVLKLNGMFAIAIWDLRQKKLILARDRLGIKPLYYTQNNSRLLFASEIKAILEDSSFKKELNEDGFFQYLAFQCILTQETMFKGIYKLQPATMLIYKDNRLEKIKYWSADESFAQSSTEEEVVESLRNAVKSHLVSDVPVGVLLSGGLDSSSIVALMHEHDVENIETFTAGFNQPDDEFGFAREVSQRFKTRHHELVINPHELKGLLGKIVWHMDEPLADGGAIATYLAGIKLKEFVKVVLVGEGGDETLGGYNWYKLSVFPFSLMPGEIKRKLYFYLTTFYNYSSRKPFDTFLSLFKDRISFFDSMSGFEINNILPNSLMMKVDKMTMAHGLEARVPFLDYTFVSKACRLDYREKVSLSATKVFFRKLMSGQLPGSILNRRKHGFLLPIDRWLQGELKDFTYDTLFSHSNQTGRLLPRNFKERLFKKKTGLANIENKSLLWKLLIFELWYKVFF